MSISFEMGDHLQVTYRRKTDDTIKTYIGELVPNGPSVNPEVAFTLKMEDHPRSFLYSRITEPIEKL